MTEFEKKSFTNYPKKQSKSCKCLQGGSCSNYKIKCEECERIQGQWTQWDKV